MNQLFYEKQIKDVNSLYNFSISGLSSQFATNGVVTGVLNDPVALQAKNDFDSLRKSLEFIPITGLITKGFNIANDVARLTGKSTTLDLYNSKKVWRESSPPSFSLSMTFYGLKSDGKDRPIDKVKALYSALFPTSNSKTFLLTAPRGYKVDLFSNSEGIPVTDLDNGRRIGKVGGKGGSNAHGTLSLRVGQWLNISNFLVASSANFTPSHQVMRDGTPLFMTGTVELEPYRMVTYNEFLNWLTQKQFKDNTKVNRALGGNTDGSGGAAFNLGSV